MLNATFSRSTQGNHHGQRTDCQIFIKTFSDLQSNDPPRMKVQYDCQIDPALVGLDVGDLACPFLVGLTCLEVLSEKVWRDVR
jgi:hypothetical protein